MATQIPEQKAPALSSEKSITVETAAIEVSSEPIQSGDVCSKPIMKPKDVKCEISTEVPPPQPLAEPLPAKTTVEQGELVSPQTTQEAAPQSESLPLEAKEPQQADLQTSLLVCKLPVQKPATPITKTDSTQPAPTEAKPETPAPAARDATQSAAPISVDSPQDIALTPPAASEMPVEDIAKRVLESVPDVTQPLTIDPGERHAEMLLAASEISTVSPVPIQVAESVLQAEPKESVLGAAVAVSDEAIATTVTAVHESTDITSAPTPMESVQLNGSACEVERLGDVTRDAAVVPGLPEKTAPPEAAKESASDTTKEMPSEVLPTIEQKVLTSSSVVPLETSSVKELAEQVAKTEAAESKPPEQIIKPETAEAKPAEQITKIETAEVKPADQTTKTEPVEEKSAEQAAKVETTETVVKQAETAAQAEVTKAPKATAIEQAETAEAAAKSPSGVPQSPVAEQSPPMEEPIEVKPLDVPSTPTVTEATPPTTPSVESALEEEAAAKKTLKKSDSTDGADGESADKKAAKKTVKKVTKKPKTKPEEAAPSVATEGATADASQSKTKKTVKTTKKTGTKTLETDTSVPETPPPTAPAGAVGIDAPVPPKRKTKGTNSKGTSGKKPDAEE